MRHLKANESIHDNLARDAAIAEMGRRLAAQAIRARRRQSGHFGAGRGLGEAGVWDAGPAPLPVTWEDALPASRPPPEPAPAARVARPRPDIPWARYVATLRLATLLGATSACGFSLVLYGEHLRVTAASRHPAAGHAAVQVQAVDEAPPAPVEETLAAGTLGAPPAEQRFAALAVPPAESVTAEMPEASVPVAEAPAGPVRLAPVAVRPPPRLAPPVAPAQSFLAAAEPRARHLAAPRLLARASPRPGPSPHVTLARFELPRWLTERPAAAPAPRIMSEPPHDLVAPQAVAHPVVPVQMAAPAPRPPPPRVAYAMAYPYRYAYAPPYYAAPYPYPLPPLRRPAFYTAQAPAPEDDREDAPDQP